MAPPTPSPSFPGPVLYIYHMKLVSVLKLIFFFQDALEVDLETFCEAMELPRT